MDFDSHMEKTEKRIDKIFRLIFAFWVFFVLFGSALAGALVYVAYKVLVHFQIL